ncbi:MAG: hypothetical protein V9E83_12880 [Baekduia sp.]
MTMLTVGIGLERGEHAVERRGVVLAVAIDLNRDVVPVRQRVLVTGLDGAADPEVERVLDYRSTLGARERRGRCRSSRRRSRRRRTPARSRAGRGP